MSAQTAAWSGEMGNAYTKRQTLTVDARKAMFARILLNLDPLPQSVIEFGANVGDNLVAISQLVPDAITIGVEPNPSACQKLSRRDGVTLAVNRSMTEPHDFASHDLAFTRGVLIHIPPHDLTLAYDALYRAAKRYVLVAEYHSPRLEDLPYHGQRGLLWKGPYAEQMLERFPGLRVRDYGFVWSRDPVAPQDDIAWFLMEKS